MRIVCGVIMAKEMLNSNSIKLPRFKTGDYYGYYYPGRKFLAEYGKVVFTGKNKLGYYYKVIALGWSDNEIDWNSYSVDNEIGMWTEYKHIDVMILNRMKRFESLDDIMVELL